MMSAFEQQDLFGMTTSPKRKKTVTGKTADFEKLAAELIAFKEFETETQLSHSQASGFDGKPIKVPCYINEFWTARQRQASSLHEISYRACFKPQLPRFFIDRLTNPGEFVYDPFMGRGTTLIEAALMGRIPLGNDVNPLSIVMTRPRIDLPEEEAVAKRLKQIPLDDPADMPDELLAFYHPDTLRGISSIKKHLLAGRKNKTLTKEDEWIALVSLNRLTGHSNGFFSVYTLPPNQAVSVKSQLRINERRKQTPPLRDVRKIILKKTKNLLADVTGEVRQTLAEVAPKAQLLVNPAWHTPEIADNTVSLVVTSPPFLNIVDYATDNWLRCWFLGYDAKGVKLTVPRDPDEWQEAMSKVFVELHRVLKPGGYVAFEVGEVLKGKVLMEELVLPCGQAAGLKPRLVLVNQQDFTKTANCWGVDNNEKGTNSNRIVLLQKE